MNEPNSPRDEYVSRLSFARASVSHQQRLHVSVGNWRLVIFLLALLVAWLSILRHLFSPVWLVIPVAVFFALAFVDDAITRKLRAAQRRVTYYQRGIARIDDKWHAYGKTGERFDSSIHPYSRDLDLFTKGGLFQLLSVARTGPGESLLAGWLLNPAGENEIQRRHNAIRELGTLLDFRDDLATTGDHALSSSEADPLWKWSEAATNPNIWPFRVASAILSAAMAASLLWYAYGALSYLGGLQAKPPAAALIVLLAIAAVTFAFGLSIRKRVSHSIAAFEEIRPGLGLLRDLLLLLERARFSSLELASLQSNLGDGVPPSRQIARLTFFSDMLDSRENLLVRIFGPPLLWSTQVSLAIESWSARHGALTRRWVESVSEIEALSSLATYSYEHPADTFPDISSGSTECLASDLAHPLLPGCVANSVSITAEHPLLIVSGSNMSGKSTLLRSIGINVVLALAGGAVRASALKLPPLSLITSIRVGDSLQEGESHFSAEIERIRQIVDIARSQPPALFLIDEILQGTNSGDRRVGSEAILGQLLDLGAIGVITTHDLALTQIGRNKPGRVVNAHFRDRIIAGKMVFDYLLKPGVVQGSNALDLMRLYGLI